MEIDTDGMEYTSYQCMVCGDWFPRAEVVIWGVAEQYCKACIPPETQKPDSQ